MGCHLSKSDNPALNSNHMLIVTTHDGQTVIKRVDHSNDIS